MLSAVLLTPPVALVVPARVFDAFGWCESDALEWRSRDPFDAGAALDGSDPARMVFVFHPGAPAFLPRERAALHAFGLGLTDEWALAPYAIDDATDELYARRVRPREVLWLAADNLNALFWGLHDWAHFHNHGPFDERAYNELQCDVCALAWVWKNRGVVGLDEARFASLCAAALALSRGRFAAENLALDASLLAPGAIAALVTP